MPWWVGRQFVSWQGGGGVRSPAEWIKALNAELPARDESHDCVVTEHDVARLRLLSPRS